MSEEPKIITREERARQKAAPFLPSRLEMAKNLVQAAVDAVKGGLDVRNGEETEAALSECVECEWYRDEGPRCGHCGCYLGGKNPDGSVRFGKLFFKAWHCPLGKW